MIEDVLPDVYEIVRQDLLDAAESRSVVDLQAIFHDLTTTMVGHMAYNVRIPFSLSIHSTKSTQMEIDSSSPFSRAFDHASSQVGLRFQNPLYRFTEPFTGGSFRSALVEVKRFGRQIVAEARKRRSKEAFESLVNNTAEEEKQYQESRNNPKTIPEGSGLSTLIDSLIESFGDPTIVADAVLNFLSAGRDTTAQSLTWTFYSLLRHPESFRRIGVEITPLLNQDTPVDMSSLQPSSLPYTMAVFYESLRLYPPVPFEIKQTTEPVTLPDGTFLPANAVVVWCIWALNRSTATFGPDAEEFNPNRWLEPLASRSSSPEPSKLKFIGGDRSAGEFPVFNGGPRSCLGKKMAEVMAMWVLVKIVGEWDIEEVNDGLGLIVNKDGEGMAERRSANSLTLPMEGGLPVRVRARKGMGDGGSGNMEGTKKRIEDEVDSMKDTA
jgi:cytochrome P450